MRLPWTVLPILLMFAAAPAQVQTASAQTAPAQTTPAEVPPVGFSGRQYIDSTGCVFLRDREGAWQARLDQTGAAVCGYPPTPITGLIPAAAPAKAAPAEAGAATSSTTGAASGRPSGATELRDFALQDGAGDGERMPGGLTDQLEAAVAAAPRIAGAAAAMTQRDSRLCNLIGVSAHEPARPPTMMGFCGSSVMARAGHDFSPAPPASRAPHAPDAPVLQGAPLADKLPTSVTGIGAGTDTPPREGGVADVALAGPSSGRAMPPGRSRPAKGQSPASARMPGTSAAAALATAATGPAIAGTPGPRSGGDNPAASGQRAVMIPATARYFVISRFPAAEPARAAAARLGAAGFPAAITADAGEGHHSVLAGPFGSREAMVRARERLIHAGFTPRGTR